jgi:DNA-binding IclR family transcriptional regulator
MTPRKSMSPAGSRPRRSAKRIQARTEAKGTIAIERGLSVLSAFTDAEPLLTLADLSRKTGLNKATLLRFIYTLERLGYVGHREDGYYHVGCQTLWLGRLYQASIGEADLIRPVLERLVKATKESASYIVKESELRICAYRVNSAYQIRDHVEIGDIRPLGRGAPGKILAAFSEAPQTELYNDIRANFFCSSHGEIERDAAGAAVPVFRGDGLAGALTITGPVNRMDELGEPKLRRVLLEEAIDLTIRLGGNAAKMHQALALMPAKTTFHEAHVANKSTISV